MGSRRGPSGGECGARPYWLLCAAAWGGLAGLLFLAVVWLIGVASGVRAWSWSDLPALMAMALALGTIVGLGVYWQWSLAVMCCSRLWRQATEDWQGGLAPRHNGEPAG